MEAYAPNAKCQRERLYSMYGWFNLGRLYLIFYSLLCIYNLYFIPFADGQRSSKMYYSALFWDLTLSVKTGAQYKMINLCNLV